MSGWNRDAPRRVLGEGRFLRLVDQGGWEFAERMGCRGVAVITALTDEGELLLTEQPRPALGAPVVELPAGLVGDEEGQEDESFEAAAHRELLEETGYRAARMELQIDGPTNAGTTADWLHFYRARELTRVGPGGGVESEEIRVHRAPLGELRSYLRDLQQRGCLLDPKIFVGVALLEGGLSR